MQRPSTPVERQDGAASGRPPIAPRPRNGLFFPLVSLVFGWGALSFLIGGLELLPALHVAFHGVWGAHHHGLVELDRAAASKAEQETSSPDATPLTGTKHGDGALAHHAQATIPGVFVPRVAFVAMAEQRMLCSPERQAPASRPRRRWSARAPPRSTSPVL